MECKCKWIEEKRRKVRIQKKPHGQTVERWLTEVEETTETRWLLISIHVALNGRISVFAPCTLLEGGHRLRGTQSSRRRLSHFLKQRGVARVEAAHSVYETGLAIDAGLDSSRSRNMVDSAQSGIRNTVPQMLYTTHLSQWQGSWQTKSSC